jgi:hypothetical protein
MMDGALKKRKAVLVRQEQAIEAINSFSDLKRQPFSTA